MSDLDIIDVDDDFTPPVPVSVENAITTCPICDAPIKKHSSAQLLACADAMPPEPGTYEEWRQQQAERGHTLSEPVAAAVAATWSPEPVADPAELAAAQEQAHAAALRAQVLEGQVRDLEKRNAVLRKQTRPASHTKARSIDDVLKVVKATPGWAVRKLPGGHIGVYRDDQKVAAISSTPGSSASVQTTCSMLRKRGLDI